MFINKLLFSLLIFTSIGVLKAEPVSVDAYLVRAGWSEQNAGWMDPETGIIWGPETEKMSWGEAKVFCTNLKLGGRTDWRLPSIDELQYSVCKAAGYPTRTACPQPRDHQKDLWLLNKDMKKGITYWASNVIPGDPYNSYYFVFDKEGQHVLTSKGDKSLARCVTQGVLPKATKVSTELAAAKVAEEQKAEPEKKEFSFYIAPFIGFGGFFTRSLVLDDYVYMSGELRLGFKVADKTMVTLFVDTGINLKEFDYPMLTTVIIGPEYFIWDNFSIFAGAGLGILTSNSNIIFPSSISTETNAGFAWKAGITFQMFKWGDNNQYSLPISLIYDGVKTSYITAHTVVGALGFMYQN